MELQKQFSVRNSGNQIRIFSVLTLLLISIAETMACEVCKANQPEVLKGITHGTGPQGNIDYIIVTIAATIVFVTLVLALKYLIRPNERHLEQIKNIVVE